MVLTSLRVHLIPVKQVELALQQKAPVGEAPGHTAQLKDLHAELAGQGLFEPSHFWRRKLLFWAPAFLLSYLGLILLPFGPLWLLLAPLSAVALLTMGFVGHDAGHYALSRRRWINDVWGHFGMTLLCGMSFGFWRSRHNLHHVRCQEIDGDPDMHFGVLFSVYPNSASWQTPLGRFFLRIQKWAFWPLASFYWVALRYDAIRDLFQRPKETRIDRFLLPLHWIVLLVIPRSGLVVAGGDPGLRHGVVPVVIDDRVGVHPQPHGHAPGRPGRKAQLHRAAGDDQPQHLEPAAARLLLRRPELADRAPPVSRASRTTATARCGRSCARSAGSAGSHTRRRPSIGRSPRSASTSVR
jgi:fatty acid desaturase